MDRLQGDAHRSTIFAALARSDPNSVQPFTDLDRSGRVDTLEMFTSYHLTVNDRYNIQPKMSRVYIIHQI